ncbi:unnamed protein product [Caretta caretta]
MEDDRKTSRRQAADGRRPEDQPQAGRRWKTTGRPAAGRPPMEDDRKTSRRQAADGRQLEDQPWKCRAAAEEEKRQSAVRQCSCCCPSGDHCRREGGGIGGCCQRQVIGRFAHRRKDVGFKEVEKDDVQELLESHAEQRTNEELNELDQQRISEESKDNNDDDVGQEARSLTTKNLSHFFGLLNEMTEITQSGDPFRVQSLQGSQ